MELGPHRPVHGEPDYKWYHHKLKGVDRERWMLPQDEGMYQNSFGFVLDNIERTVKHIPEDDRQLCVQAGGCFGLWPYLYSLYFEEVVTYEPMPVNLKCLKRNISDRKNITAFRNALSDKEEMVDMTYSKPNLNSYGAHHTKSEGRIQAWPLDEFYWERLDHLQLDVEGDELKVLKGAERVIGEFTPLITLEVRNLPHMTIPAARAETWLKKTFGYREIDRFAGDRLYSV